MGWGETSLSGPKLTLALLVRLDLGMSPGTLAAQCVKAALAAARKAEGSGRSDSLAVWREAGESMIILGAEDAASLDAILVVSERWGYDVVCLEWELIRTHVIALCTG